MYNQQTQTETSDILTPCPVSSELCTHLRFEPHGFKIGEIPCKSGEIPGCYGYFSWKSERWLITAVANLDSMVTSTEEADVLSWS